jgi:hypothetical protein
MHEWRSHFGSVAVAMVNAFFDSDNVAAIFATDDARIEFANEMLEDFAFLYEDTAHDDPKASALRHWQVI